LFFIAQVTKKQGVHAEIVDTIFDVLYRLIHALDIPADMIFRPDGLTNTPKQEQFFREVLSASEFEQDVAMAAARSVWHNVISKADFVNTYIALHNADITPTPENVENAYNWMKQGGSQAQARVDFAAPAIVAQAGPDGTPAMGDTNLNNLNNHGPVNAATQDINYDIPAQKTPQIYQTGENNYAYKNLSVAPRQGGSGFTVHDSAGTPVEYSNTLDGAINKMVTRAGTETPGAEPDMTANTFVSQNTGKTYKIPSISEISHVDNTGKTIIDSSILDNVDGKDYRDFAKAFAGQNYATQIDPITRIPTKYKEIAIKNDGYKLLITNTGLADVVKKIRGNRVSDRTMAASLLNLPSIIENSEFVKSEPNLKTDNGFPPYRYYQSTTNIDGKDYNVDISILDTPHIGRYRYHSLSDIANIKIEPSNSVSTAKSSEWPIPHDGSIDNSIAQTKPVVNSNISHNAENYAELT